MPRNRPAAALVAVALLAVGCTGDTTPEPVPTSPTDPTGTPRAAGELVVAYPQEPATLDPFAPAGEAPVTRDLTRLLMPGLYRIGPGGERTRWLLADEPEVQTGPPFAVTLRLREDAVWSDGTPITVADLRFTWRRVLERPAASRDGYDAIARIEDAGDRTVRIVFRHRFERWRDLFSAGLGVLPAHALREDPEALADAWPVSGGPFVFQRWRTGLDLVFTANPRAWGGDAPGLRRLRVVFVPDATGALELFRRGEIDVLGPYLAADWLRRAAEVSGAGVTAETGPTWAGLVFNARAGPFDDVRVRRAFAHAIDRARIARGLVGDEGAVLHSATPAPGEAGAGPFSVFGDLGQARRLLEEAGWRGGPPRRRGNATLEATLAFGAEGLSGVVVRAIQFQTDRVGFDVQAVSLEARHFWDGWLDGPELRAAFVVWREPPEGSMRARFAPTGPSGARMASRARLSDEALTAALDRADRGEAVDPEERLAALVPVLPLFTVTVSLVAGARAHGVCASGGADGPLWNAHRWTVEQQDAVCPTVLQPTA